VHTIDLKQPLCNLRYAGAACGVLFLQDIRYVREKQGGSTALTCRVGNTNDSSKEHRSFCTLTIGAVSDG